MMQSHNYMQVLDKEMVSITAEG